MTETQDRLDRIRGETIELIDLLDEHAERIISNIDRATEVGYHTEKESFFKERDLTYEQIYILEDILDKIYDVESVEKEISRLP